MYPRRVFSSGAGSARGGLRIAWCTSVRVFGVRIRGAEKISNTTFEGGVPQGTLGYNRYEFIYYKNLYYIVYYYFKSLFCFVNKK